MPARRYRRLVPTLGLFLLAALLTPGLLSQERNKGAKYAFLVGCSDYKKTELRPLPYTGADVEGFRKALLATGFDEDHVVMLHDDMPQTRYRPVKAHILYELEALLDGMNPEDTLVVALSGHGVHFKGEPTGYFCPSDAVVANKSSLIAMEGKGSLFEMLRACKARQKLLIVNACRNDPTLDIAQAANRMPLDDAEPEEVPEGIAAIYSCKPGQKSYYDPDRKISFFYDHLIRAWKGEYSPGAERLDLEEVLRKVVEQTRLDVNRTLQVKQVPVVRREYRGEWIVAVHKAAGPTSAANPAPPAEKDLLARLRPASANTYAVLVGVDGAGAGVKPRPGAEADARALYDLLRSKDHLGVPAENVKLLLGTPADSPPSVRATRANILQALAWLEQRTTKKDQVIVGLFGSGAPAGNEYCLFAADSSYSHRPAEAVTDHDLEHRLRTIACKRLALFFDIDYLGFVPAPGAAPNANLGALYRAFITPDESVGKRNLFASCNGVTAPLAEKGRSVFARILIDGLRGKADRSGYEADGFVTADELEAYLQKEFGREALRLGADALEKKQAALAFKNHHSDFPLVVNPTAYPTAVARLGRFETAAAAAGLGGPVRAEGRELLGLMPRRARQQALRRKYQEFVDGRLDASGLLQARQEIVAQSQLPRAQAQAVGAELLGAYGKAEETWMFKPALGDFTAAAVAELYRAADEPVPLEIESRLKVKLTRDDAARLFAEARMLLGRREDLDGGKDLTVALKGALQRFDARAEYYDPADVAALGQQPRGVVGVGVQVRYDRVRDGLEVVTPLFGGPAYKAGLRAGDLIRTIVQEAGPDGKPLALPQTHSTRGMTANDAVKLVLGKPGTRVRLTVERPGVEAPLELTVTRGPVTVETVLGHRRGAGDRWDYWLDPQQKIAYIRITQVANGTPAELKRALDTLLKDGLRALVLDVRFSPGGLLTGAIDIADRFIDDGLIVTVRPRAGEPTEFRGKVEGSLTSFPVVCLVNGSSAAGAEIIAAALQDHRRGAIAGQRSYGLAGVRTVYQLDNGGAILVTTGTLVRPSGKNLDKSVTRGREDEDWGVRPDPGLDVPLSPSETEQLNDYLRAMEVIAPAGRPPHPLLTSFEDRQLARALAYLRGELK